MSIRFIIILAISISTCACNKSENIIRQLEEVSMELPDDKPMEYSDSDLAPFLEDINEGVIALGEASHGSSTLFELKHRLLKYLVEIAGCRALCYEFSFEKGLDINRYVLYGKGDIDSLLYDKYWIQSNSTIKYMLSWMKDYNDGRQMLEKVHFIGIDNQLDMFNPSRLKYHFNTIGNDLAEFAGPELNELAGIGKPEYRNMEDSYFSYINDLITRIEEKTEGFLKEEKHSISDIDQEILFHLIHSIRESHDFLYKAYNGGPNNRDKFMADNVLWARSLFENNEVIALWAHNSHISSNPDYYGEGEGTMGYYLRNELKEKYLRIGTSYNRGSVIAVEEDTINGGDTPPHIIKMDTIPVRGSVNELFSRPEYNNFGIDLRDIDKESELYIYLDTLRPFLGIGDYFTGKLIDNYSYDRIVNLARWYDIIFHIDKIEPIDLQGKWIKQLITGMVNR